MLQTEFERYKILLASKSPRRQKLLQELGFHYKLIDIEVDESYPEHLFGAEIPMYLCRKKADACDPKFLKKDTILVTADTIVWLDNSCIGKPADRAQSIEILKKLSGRRHSVYTGICLRSAEKEIVFSAHTSVTFSHLADEEINFYVDNFQPFDKAGSYGIQDWVGLTGVKKIDGCFYNVMGFPVQRFYRELKKFIRQCNPTGLNTRL